MSYQRDENNVSYMYTLPTNGQRDISFYKPPPITGYWVLPCQNATYKTKFAGYKKPNWFHRMTMKWLIGWGWEEVK